jgi:hypothetical protein
MPCGIHGMHRFLLSEDIFGESKGKENWVGTKEFGSRPENFGS